jgi:pimeloyl-ACP methyl ester carboxylesterase
MIPGLFAKNFKSMHQPVISDEITRGLKLTDTAIVAFYNAMINRPDRTSTLKNAAFPVQWIIGKEDNVAPLDKVAQQSMLADVNFVSVYTDCAHMSMLEKPQALIRDLEEFGQYCYS